MARVLVDSGIWLGLCDSQDQWHDQAKAIVQELSPVKLLLPWPTFYETLSTRFVKKSHQVLSEEMEVAEPDAATQAA